MNNISDSIDIKITGMNKVDPGELIKALDEEWGKSGINNKLKVSGKAELSFVTNTKIVDVFDHESVLMDFLERKGYRVIFHYHPYAPSRILTVYHPDCEDCPTESSLSRSEDHPKILDAYARSAKADACFVYPIATKRKKWWFI